MKIESLRSEINGNRARVSANISWEDNDRPALEAYFETDEEFGDDLTCNPHAFLLGSIMPALRHGEKRIWIDSEVCPELREGLVTAMSWMRHWHYGADHGMVEIECGIRSTLQEPRTPERAGFFFSGGIDSLAALRNNRLHFPAGHPWSIRDGLIVYGLEIDDPDAYGNVLNTLSPITRDAGVELIPVYTNIRSLDDDWVFWEDVYEGSVFSAIAHAFARRLTVVSISSTLDIPNIFPYASHPLIDPNYSSNDLRIRHDGVAMTRLSKTGLVADWDIALQNLRVCNKIEKYQPGILNCCTCEKCLRTMLALYVLGKLEKTSAFQINSITEDLVRTAVRINETTIGFYRELVQPLNEMGRSDLANEIQRKIAVYQGRQPGIRGNIKRLDLKYLDGKLLKLKKLFSYDKISRVIK
jgi:hypothetical protein